MLFINEDMIRSTVNTNAVEQKDKKLKKKINWLEPPGFIFILGLISFNLSLWMLPISLMEKIFLLNSAIIISGASFALRRKIRKLTN